MLERLESKFDPKRNYPPVFLPHYGSWLEIEDALCSLDSILAVIEVKTLEDLRTNAPEILLNRAIVINASYKALYFSHPTQTFDRPYHASASTKFAKIDAALNALHRDKPELLAEKAERALVGSRMIDRWDKRERCGCGPNVKNTFQIAFSDFFTSDFINAIITKICLD